MIAELEACLAASEEPAPGILDLEPGMEPFAFLERLRATVPGSRTAVLVWASEELTWQRRAQLDAATQAVVVKGQAGPQALLEELQACLAGAGGRR